MTDAWAGAATAAAGLLAAVLAAAALAKLRRPAATAASLAALRLPAPRLLAAGVPAVELAVAGLLLVRPRAGGAAALVLLAAFTAVLARTLAAHDARHRPTCGCFGAADDRPVSATHLARNGALAVAAAGALAAPTPVAPGLAGVVLVSTAALLAAVALAALDLRRQLGRFVAIDLAGATGDLPGTAGR